ncbi:MAG: UDP-2,3-diacylglucosamine diphosphatase [Pseudomonadota bacterium]|uniref:UDP-2,3-diacylglucosamine diphosphatase n=1 Tax=Thermithiobacillus tepidarius TaxID=929 RepID=UPI001B7FE854|nr:UDP-2,3-diacylglucosamine diphosphatase [Thermithiobacillus tepidarius]
MPAKMTVTGPILFISDLHLSATRPQMVQLFLRFLEERAAQAAALYILGDFFEYWVGRGAEQEPAHGEIIDVLRALTGRGVPVWIMGGNRDFMLGADFARRSGARILPDPSVIILDGQPALLTHGDRLCTDDVAYQRFRRVIQHPLTRATLGRLPYAWRTRLAGNLRNASHNAMQHKAPVIMDVNPDAVLAACRGDPPYPSAPHGQPYPLLIHGHTHRPAVHHYTIDGHACRRIVLGDWYETGSVLCCEGGECRLERFGVA